MTRAKPGRLTPDEVAARQAARVKAHFNRCGPVTEALAAAMAKNGHEAQVVRCSGLRPYAPDAHPKWTALGSQFYWVHYVVRVGDYAYDLTRRQFFPDSPQPFKQDWASFLAEWEEIEAKDAMADAA